MNKDLKGKFGFTLAEGATHVGISHNIGGTLHRFVESFTHVGISHNTRRVGFTLAEVLITLGIIGIVSAMTIPTLVKNYQTKVRDNQFKKVYATLNQAVLFALTDFGYIPKCYYHTGGGTSSQAECKKFYNKIAEKMKVVKYCPEKSFENGCIPHYDGLEVVSKENHKNDADYDEQYWNDRVMNNLSGFSTNNIKNKASSYVFADGTILIPYTVSYGMERLFMIDINGIGGENKIGYDLHSFKLEYNGNKFSIRPIQEEVSKGGISTYNLWKKLFVTY